MDGGQRGATDTTDGGVALPSMAHLSEGDRVRDILLRVQGVQTRRSRSRPETAFLVGQVADATGAVDFIAFDLEPERMEAVRSAGLVRVTGEAGVHNGRLQLKASRVEPVAEAPDEDACRRLFPRSARDVEAMLADVRGRLAAIEHPALRAIARAYVDDAALMDRFRVAPAATSYHHAWIGGLLEHTWEMLRAADGILGGPGGAASAPPLFPDLDRDLVALAIFLHDLGKTRELAWDMDFRYTRWGNLVGHVVGAAIDLDRRARDLQDDDGRPLVAPEPLLDHLAHVLVSHHGRLEYGAAKVPATPEAVFVARLDELMARTSAILEVADRGRTDLPEFSEPIWSLDTRVFRPSPSEVEPRGPGGVDDGGD